MTNSINSPALPTERSGQSNIPQGSERAHTLIVFVQDRPGSVDRVVGLLRRRRANMQTLVLGYSEQPDIVRITIVVKDSEVAIEQLVEQMRKVVDVQRIANLTEKQAIVRELAFIKVNCTATRLNEIIAVGELYGAHIVDTTLETVTLEVVGSEEKIETLVELLREFGIREIARSGCVAMERSTVIA